MVCLSPPAEARWANPGLLLCFVFVSLPTYQQYMPLLLVLLANAYSVVFSVGATLSLVPQKWGTEPVCIPNSFWEVLAWRGRPWGGWIWKACSFRALGQGFQATGTHPVCFLLDPELTVCDNLIFIITSRAMAARLPRSPLLVFGHPSPHARQR